MRVKRTGTVLLASVLALGMWLPGLMGSAFAAERDRMEDVSSDTATIVMGKVLTVNQAGKFPQGLEDASFRLEAVRAWDNANVSTEKSGTTIAVSDMPMPKASTEAHHEIEVNGTSARVSVGDFRTDEKDSDTVKTRTTDVEITFGKAGYYLYQITETGITPSSVSGVTLDDHSYYVVIYVANKMNEDGTTAEGVYVHNITSYRNEDGSDEYQPDLSDISNQTDHGGKAAADNTDSNLDKVGSSTSEQPNRLEAYRFWNSQMRQDLVLKNQVEGNLGDTTKEFEFSVTITGLEPGATYATNETASNTGDETSEGTKFVSTSVGELTTSGITADESGNVTVLIKMKSGETTVVKGLPATATYEVTERESDHIARYTVDGSGEKAVISKSQDANSEANQTLTTAKETVNAEDGTVTVTFINERNLATVTGVRQQPIPYALMLLVIVGLVVRWKSFVRKRL